MSAGVLSKHILGTERAHDGTIVADTATRSASHPAMYHNLTNSDGERAASSGVALGTDPSLALFFSQSIPLTAELPGSQTDTYFRHTPLTMVGETLFDEPK